MKGIVFCEFLDMVDTTFSPALTEKLIDSCDLPSGGAYTSVGTYEHDEIIALVSALSNETGLAVNELVYSFGYHLFSRFMESSFSVCAEISDTFEFLESVDEYIHVEVRKLYPDAQLPTIKCKRLKSNHLVLTYQSGRSMGDLAHGLIQACIDHFKQPITLTREDLSGGTAQCIRFNLVKQGS